MASEPEQLLARLRARRSVPALQLQPPGPSAAEVEAALATALRAPDHGALRPWRFVLIRDEAARARLADLFVRRMLERNPPAPPHKVEKARIMPRTAPLVIAVGARVLREHKIPEIEQLLSSGAAVMNLLNAFHIQGYGAILLTGDNAYDPVIAGELGFAPDERCLGFVYVGSLPAQLQLPAPARVPREGCVREWSG